MAFGSIIKSFAAPGAEGRGLAFDGTHLWYTDAGTDLLYMLDARTGRVIKTLTVPDTLPLGVTWDGAYLWVAGGTGTVIFQMDTRGRVLKTIVTPTVSATGMAWDGNNLWISDNTSDTILIVDPDSNRTIRSLPPLGGTAPRGLTFTGNRMIFTDSGTGLIYFLDMEGRILKTTAVPATNVGGLAYDGNAGLWAASFSTDLIYQVALS